MAEGHPVKWVFDGSKLDRVTVKRRALEAMREPGFRREVDGILEDQIAREKLRQILKRERARILGSCSRLWRTIRYLISSPAAIWGCLPY